MSIPLNTYSGILAPTIFKIILSQDGYDGIVGGDMTWLANLNYKPDAIPTIVIDISGGNSPSPDNHGEFIMTKVTDLQYKYVWRTYYSPPQFDYDQTCNAFIKAVYNGKQYTSNIIELDGG